MPNYYFRSSETDINSLSAKLEAVGLLPGTLCVVRVLPRLTRRTIATQQYPGENPCQTNDLEEVLHAGGFILYGEFGGDLWIGRNKFGKWSTLRRLGLGSKLWTRIRIGC